LLKNLNFLRNAKVRVLVIDDTQKNLEIIGQFLSENNYDVAVAKNGERGIAIARKLQPDIILLDIMMPDMNGYEVCKRLKADSSTAQIPVIFLTAKADHDDIMQGFEAGAVDYIVKPFLKDELFARIKTHSELSIKSRQEHMLSSILDRYVLNLIIDIEGNMKYISTAFLEVTGYEPEDIMNKSFDMLKHPSSFRSELSEIIDSVKNNFIYYKEIKIRTKQGKKLVMNTFVEPVVCVDGTVTGAQCFMTDVTSKKELEHLSITDKLTDLYNRQKLDEVLNYEYSQSTRYGSVFSIVILDLDDFKKINDTLGHLVGDDVLKTVSKIIKSSIRDSDTGGRWGGEEFMIILPKTSEEEASHVAEKLRSSVESTDFGINIPLTCSMGVSSTDGRKELKELLSNADKAMYKAKRSGKNKVIKASEL